jgi:hypothetical protein
MLLAAFSSVYLYWRWNTPTPGKSVAMLAAAAAVITFRAEMKGGEKFLWSLLLIGFLVMEFTSIDKDHQQQAQVLKEERERFGEIGRGIDATIKQSEQGFAATTQRSNEIMVATAKAIGLSHKALSELTGGDSYAYFSAVPNMGSGSPVTYPMTVWIDGIYPMRNMSATIQRIETGRDPESIQRQLQSWHTILLSDTLLPGPHFVNERIGLGEYSVGIWAANGLINEQMNLRIAADGQLLQSITAIRDGRVLEKEVDGKLTVRKGRPVKQQ